MPAIADRGRLAVEVGGEKWVSGLRHNSGSKALRNSRAVACLFIPQARGAGAASSECGNKGLDGAGWTYDDMCESEMEMQLGRKDKAKLVGQGNGKDASNAPTRARLAAAEAGEGRCCIRCLSAAGRLW